MVTVIIPTYNRAHLLKRTVPSYLQPAVDRLILVDDASQDNTQGVISELKSMFCERITSLRNETNRKQTFSKNAGKRLAVSPWIYFGDDDAVLTDGSIHELLKCAADTGADIVGATPLYCLRGESTESALARFKKSPPVSDPIAFVDWSALRIRHTLRAAGNIALPVTHASFLVRTSLAQLVDFDTSFIGTAYREETDFLLTCHCGGARIMFCPYAQQINLPPEVASGGTRSYSRVVFEWYYVANTAMFLRKHRKFFTQELHSTPVLLILLRWILERAASGMRKLLK